MTEDAIARGRRAHAATEQTLAGSLRELSTPEDFAAFVGPEVSGIASRSWLTSDSPDNHARDREEADRARRAAGWAAEMRQRTCPVCYGRGGRFVPSLDDVEAGRAREATWRPCVVCARVTS